MCQPGIILWDCGPRLFLVLFVVLAVELLEAMLQVGLEPNVFTYSATTSACE